MSDALQRWESTCSKSKMNREMRVAFNLSVVDSVDQEQVMRDLDGRDLRVRYPRSPELIH